METFVLNPGSREALDKGFGQQGAFGDARPEDEALFGLNSRDASNPAAGRVVPFTGSDPRNLIVPEESAGGSPPAPSPSDAGKGSQAAAAERWKEALSAARAGAGRATQAASLPQPVDKLKGTLSGLAAAGSGAKSAASLDARGPQLSLPSSDRFLSGPRVSQSLSPTQATPDYRGPANRGLASGTGMSQKQMEDLSFRSGSFFDRGGGANSLLKAEQVAEGVNETGPGSTGAGMQGGEKSDKPADSAAATTAKDTKEYKPGEQSLQMLAMKMEMEKSIALKWDKKKYEELDRKKMMEQVLMQAAAQMLTQSVVNITSGLMGLPIGGGGQSGGSGQPGNVQGGPLGGGLGGQAQ